jgi:hypothetical protein
MPGGNKGHEMVTNLVDSLFRIALGSIRFTPASVLRYSPQDMGRRNGHLVDKKRPQELAQAED